MINVDPWAPLIFKETFDGSLLNIKNKIDLLFLGRELNDKRTVSSFTYNINPLMWDELKSFIPFLTKNIHHCASKWKYSYQEYCILNSWFINIHKDGYVNSHVHRSSQMTVIFCIDNTEAGSKITVKNPLQYHWASVHNLEAENMELENKDYEIPMAAGDMLIMPPWMYHGTSINTSNNPSYFMALNVGGS